MSDYERNKGRVFTAPDVAKTDKMLIGALFAVVIAMHVALWAVVIVAVINKGV